MVATPPVHQPRIKDPISARDLSSMWNERAQRMRQAGFDAVEKPYEGISTEGSILPGVFEVKPTGVSTEPIRHAALTYLASLDSAKRQHAVFPVDTDEWRKWCNVHMFFMRHGVSMEEMSTEQRDAALALMHATLSESGLETARNIMRLNETIREITGRDIEFGEWPYWISIMGDPSVDEPWGWQIDGHHLIINCFVLGDQLVMTPMFMGSEPTLAPSGKYKGTRVFEQEDAFGLRLMQSLTPDQRSKAIIAEAPPIEVFGASYSDNFDLRLEGVSLSSLSDGQSKYAMDLVETYVRRIRPGHDEAWLNEIKKHLDQTYFAWMGGTGDDSAFYYRVHSPVILIEFDHLAGVALDSDTPTRNHIHTTIRTPNGNDYGKDLLRQHYELSHLSRSMRS